MEAPPPHPRDPLSPFAQVCSWQWWSCGGSRIPSRVAGSLVGSGLVEEARLVLDHGKMWWERVRHGTLKRVSLQPCLQLSPVRPERA